MEWEEGPIPVWIDSISIDMDEMPTSDLLISVPNTPKSHSFLSYNDQSKLLPLLDESSFNMTFDINESPSKAKQNNAPSLSPIKNKQETSKPPRKTRRKVNVDPSGRKLRRKSKQRGYEKGYRSRQKLKRCEDAAEWIALEIQMREMLHKRTSVLKLQELPSDSTVSIRQKYLELLQEERALREAEALDGCVLAAEQGMALWGGTTAASRETRGQVNALPSLRSCLTFDFQW